MVKPLRQSSVPAGYKQTEIGVIPEDWEVKSLGELAIYTNGKAHEGSIDDTGQYVVANSKFISTDGLVRKHSNDCLLPADKGDILMVMSDVPNGRAIARTFFVGRGNYYTVNQRICLLHPTQVEGRLLYYNLNRNPFYLAFDDGAKQTNLRKIDVLSCPLAIPPTLAEQQAIAGALSDVDELIGSLDKLIDKKRAIKTAAMQQLLTGKQRLPGFSGEWKKTTFSKLLRHHSGNSTLIKGKLSDFPTAGLFPAYSASGQDVWHFNYEHEGDALIVSAVGSRCGRTFRASGKWSAVANTHVVWSNDKLVDMCFLLLFLNNESFWLKSGSGQPFVLFKQSFGRNLMLPSLSEQTAIAKVLSDMDAEIDALEARLEKTKAIKQGMMQELLTGKVRLV